MFSLWALLIQLDWNIDSYPLQAEFEDTKGVIRIRKSKKNRQHNVQKKKYKTYT